MTDNLSDTPSSRVHPITLSLPMPNGNLKFLKIDPATTSETDFLTLSTLMDDDDNKCPACIQSQPHLNSIQPFN